jgi:hypothetical protein
MSKFKVGDKVKIASQSICDIYDMLGIKVGDVVEILEINPDGGRFDAIMIEHDCIQLVVRLSDLDVEAIDHD